MSRILSDIDFNMETIRNYENFVLYLEIIGRPIKQYNEAKNGLYLAHYDIYNSLKNRILPLKSQIMPIYYNMNQIFKWCRYGGIGGGSSAKSGGA